uniref:CSON014495 protein n=1 Tax=Culicoides sonorensis TaxID=179676 RepID=A0A336MAU1_CULSO
MAYINVAEWSVENVVDWLKGLDSSMYRYLTSFTNNQINGTNLLNIRPYELEELGIKSIGHQEIILEGLEVLKNFHYNLDKENLQFLALHVATCAHSLYKQLSGSLEQDRIGTNTLKDVTRTISNVKKLVFWLDRKPFHGKRNYHEIRTNMLKLSLEMATCAQRGRFVVDPVKQISQAAVRLAKIADYVIQDISDPMLIQPASLALVTLKKRESDLGFYIVPVMNGIHQIGDIKYNSPTHNSKQVEEGDEIVQINYQTVVGWQYEKVLLMLRECAPDVLLTIKKRPKDSKTFGQIYVKPYMKLPSKKRSFNSRWNDTLPSPREWTGTHNYFSNMKPHPEKLILSDSDSSSSDLSTHADNDIKDAHKEQFYIPKSRGVLQRRHSICGDGYSMIKALDLMAANKFKDQRLDDSPSLRDKSISFGFGLEQVRPTTHTGIGNQQTVIKDKENVMHDKPVKIKPEIKPKPVERKLPPPPVPTRLDLLAKEQANNNLEKDDKKLGELQGISKVVRFDSNTKLEASHIDTKYTCNVENTVLETFVPIPYADEDNNSNINAISGANQDLPLKKTLKTTSVPLPSNDNEKKCDEDVPPAIEPRQSKKKPIPPPRPSKTLNIITGAAIIHQTSLNMNESMPSPSAINVSPPMFVEAIINSEKMIGNNNQIDENKSKVANVIALKSTREIGSCKDLPNASGIGNESPLELHTSITGSKALTLKKKNSLLSKRRKVTLKSFTSSDIQGHLYRRLKNRHGVTYWKKLYIVLIDTTLYGFKSKDASKADCLVFLVGFTVTKANEVHSKEFPFKVYHPNKTFYFAAETEEAQKQWIDYIHQATLKGTVPVKSSDRNALSVKDPKELFSETDSSDDENGAFNASQLATPSPSINNSSSRNKDVSKDNGEPSTPTTTKSEGRYHLGFGSLKKSLRNLNSSEGSPSDNKFLSLFTSSRHSERKNSIDIPVPTSQFKSYRKMPVNVNIQAGTVTLNNRIADYPSVPSPKRAFECNTSHSNLNRKHSTGQESFTFKGLDQELEEEGPIFEKVDFGQNNMSAQQQDENYNTENIQNATAKSTPTNKPSVYNHMHASNPNLVEFTIAGYDRAPKDIELTCPKTSSMNRDWDASHNTNGFMTLKDLMLLEQAENAKDPYNKRVCLGIEKHDDKNNANNNLSVPSVSISGKNEESGAVDNVDRTKINKIQKRSLPVTPDYAQSFKPDDQDILYTRSREGQKLRDFGYELITGDDRVELKNNLQAQQQQAANASNHDDSSHSRTKTKASKQNSNETVIQSVKKRSMNWMNSSSHFGHSNNHSDSKDRDKSSIGGSFNKKHKNKSAVIEKFDHLKASSEKLFHFKNVNTANETENLKSKQTNVKTNLTNMNTTNWNLVENHKVGLPSVPQTSDRGALYLTKLPFSNKANKEKKLLGSPRLHRAIFGNRNNGEREEPKAIDHEIFSPINYNNKNTNEIANKSITIGFTNQAMEMDISPSSLAPPVSLSQLNAQNHDLNFVTSNNANAQNMNNNLNNSNANSNINSAINNMNANGADDISNGNSIEYPPIFEAEIYSLSSNLLKRRHQNNK